MKIYFCDVCNESIPLQDIKDNKAVTLGGKIYCRNCNPLKEVKESAPSASSRSGWLYLGIILVLVGACVVLLVWNPLSRKEEVATKAALAAVQQRLGPLERNGVAQENRLRAVESGLRDLNAALTDLKADLTRLEGDVRAQRDEIENISRNFEAVTKIRETLDGLSLKQEEFGTTMEGLQGNVTALKQGLAGMESRLSHLAENLRKGIRRTSAGTASPTSETGTDEAVIGELRKKLASKDDGERFEAVYKVLDDRIKAALPLVVPLILDRDQFVQVGAIQTVGEFLYMAALPNLVKALRDPDVTVRDEALRQLIRMTGKNDLNFDVRASDTERERAVKKWEKFLKSRG